MGLGSPDPLRRFSARALAGARAVPSDPGRRTPIDPGPDGVLAPIAAVVDRAHDRWQVYAVAARQGLGGLAYAADFIAVGFPEVDANNAGDLTALGAAAMRTPR